MDLHVTKDDTLKLRMDAETAELMERARGFVKLDKSKFVRLSIREKAEAIIAQHEKTTFTEEDWHAFFDMVDNPPAPKDHLKKF